MRRPDKFPSRREVIKRLTAAASAFSFIPPAVSGENEKYYLPGDKGYEGPLPVEKEETIGGFQRLLREAAAIFENGSESQIAQVVRRAPMVPHYSAARNDTRVLDKYYPPLNVNSFTGGKGLGPWQSVPAHLASLRRLPQANEWFRQRDIDPEYFNGIRVKQGLLVSSLYLAGSQIYGEKALKDIRIGDFATLIQSFDFQSIASEAPEIAFSQAPLRTTEYAYAAGASLVRVRGGVEGHESTENSGRTPGTLVQKKWVTTFPTGVLIHLGDKNAIRKVIAQALVNNLAASFPLPANDDLRKSVERLLAHSYFMVATDSDGRETAYIKFGGGLCAPVFAQTEKGVWDIQKAVGLLVGSVSFSASDGSDIRGYIVLDGIQAQNMAQNKQY